MVFMTRSTASPSLISVNGKDPGHGIDAWCNTSDIESTISLRPRLTLKCPATDGYRDAGQPTPRLIDCATDDLSAFRPGGRGGRRRRK